MGRSAPPIDAKSRYTVDFNQQNTNENNIDAKTRKSVLPRRRLQNQTPFIFNSPISSAVSKKFFAFKNLN